MDVMVVNGMISKINVCKDVCGVYVEGPACLVLPWLQNHKHGIGIYYCNITCICI